MIFNKLVQTTETISRCIAFLSISLLFVYRLIVLRYIKIIYISFVSIITPSIFSYYYIRTLYKVSRKQFAILSLASSETNGLPTFEVHRKKNKVDAPTVTAGYRRLTHQCRLHRTTKRNVIRRSRF
jgi:hypothetical protein